MKNYIFLMICVIFTFHNLMNIVAIIIDILLKIIIVILLKA